MAEVSDLRMSSKKTRTKRRVGELERHHHELEMAVVGAECRLGDVVRVHEHLMTVAAEVEFGEEASAVKFIEKFLDHRDREFALDGLGVSTR